MNELNYASQEPSKRLVDAGIVLETDFYWVKEKTNEADHYELMLKVTDLFYPTKLSYYTRFRMMDCDYIPAPSMAEVWRELPDSKDLLGLILDYDDELTEPEYLDILRDINKLIDLLIWVTEQKRKEKV